MAFRSKATRKLESEISHGLDKYQQQLMLNLVRGTPIDTGNAQKGWKETAEMSKVLGTGTSKIVIRNDVEYIQRLDEGHSRQAPRGIVQPALQRTRKP